MIDEKYQGKGYERKALSILLNELRELKVKEVDIIHKPDNEAAIKLYTSFGFKLTEDKLNDDVISIGKLV